MRNESEECFLPMGPYEKDIVNEPFRYGWRDRDGLMLMILMISPLSR